MFRLVVVTPFKEVYNLEVKRLITQSLAGKIEILSSHSPFITILAQGISQFEDSNGEMHSVNNSKAIMKVNKDEVIIICEDIEREKDLV